MGQVASNGVNNLSYFQSGTPISDELHQAYATVGEYDNTKTYISFIMGDGDNVSFMKGGRRDFMEERLKKCEDAPTSCFPLLWTISPALLTIAPDWIRWYYGNQDVTKNEFFVLPPSGDTYSYPSEMTGTDADNF
jgi:hypothetical protein